MTLKEWLDHVKKTGGQKDDDMIQFASHISKGMEHIQAKGILHRKLAARNVFLARSAAVGLIAKVSGFGPMRGEEGKYGKKVADRIPIKWMAPESLTKEEGKERVYTKETDVWSFGITLWEIYSLGLFKPNRLLS
jgi:serine/threonine protein kinase